MSVYYVRMRIGRCQLPASVPSQLPTCLDRQRALMCRSIARVCFGALSLFFLINRTLVVCSAVPGACPANSLAEVLIRFQLGVPSLRSLFFPVLRLLIRVGDTVLWGVLAVRFGLIGFHVLELPSLGNIDVVSLCD